MEPHFFQTIVPAMKTASSKTLQRKGPKFFFREWRKKRKMTQERLAELVGVTPPSISQLENGKQGFTDTTLLQIAEALNCHPGELLMKNPDFRDGWRDLLQKSVDRALAEGARPEHIRAEIERIAPLLRIEDEADHPSMDDPERRLREYAETSAARLDSQNSKSK